MRLRGASGRGGFLAKNLPNTPKLRQRRAFGIPIFVAAKILSWLGFCHVTQKPLTRFPRRWRLSAWLASIASFTAAFRKN